MAYFNDARLKIEWAKHHIALLETQIGVLEKSNVSTIEFNPEFGNEVIKHDISDRNAISDIALIAGDCVHNLKCALDYSWIEIITKLAPQALRKFAKFPVYPTDDALKAALRANGIDQAPGRLFEIMLTEIKPYANGDHAIWPIHRLNIRDKHRLLIPTVLYSSVSGIETQDHTGVVSRDGFTMGTHQQPPWYIPMPVGVHVMNNGKVSLSISFEYGSSIADSIFPDMLQPYPEHLLRIVERLETLV